MELGADDDNNLTLENVSSALTELPQTSSDRLKEGQLWGWNEIDHRRDCFKNTKYAY